MDHGPVSLNFAKDQCLLIASSWAPAHSCPTLSLDRFALPEMSQTEPEQIDHSRSLSLGPPSMNATIRMQVQLDSETFGQHIVVGSLCFMDHT